MRSFLRGKSHNMGCILSHAFAIVQCVEVVVRCEAFVAHMTLSTNHLSENHEQKREEEKKRQNTKKEGDVNGMRVVRAE